MKKIKRKILLFTIFWTLILCQIISAQVYFNDREIDESKKADSSSVRIKKIAIVGNKKTKDQLILRELLFSENDLVSFKQLSAAQKRVQSLNLFTRVRFDVVEKDQSFNLLITVNEQWYFFIYPTFYLNEKDWQKISYGVSLRHYNLMGKNIFLKLKAVNGFNPLYQAIYQNPWFLGKGKLYSNFRFFKTKVNSRSARHQNLTDDRIGIDWALGKRFGHFTFVGVDVNYCQISAPPEMGLTASVSGIDKLLSLTSGFTYDHRDLAEYPHQGWLLQCGWKLAGLQKGTVYHQHSATLRHYVPISQKMTLALRAAGLISSGQIPIYDRVYFGYEERIRGRFYEILEGENYCAGNVELRFRLLKISYFDLPMIHRLKSYVSNLKFGLSAGIFYDTGTVWSKNQKWSIQHFKSGYGLGLHLHLPYINLLRLEYGFNSQGQIQRIVDFDVAF